MRLDRRSERCCEFREDTFKLGGQGGQEVGEGGYVRHPEVREDYFKKILSDLSTLPDPPL